MRRTLTLIGLVAPGLLAAACAAHQASAPPAYRAGPATTALPPIAPAPEAAPAAADRGDGAYPGFRVPAFTAMVRRPAASGVKEEMIDSRAARSPTLYIINSTTCPYCAGYVDRMKALESKYMPLGVDVVHVYANRKEVAAEKIEWHARQGFRGGQILDSDASIARSLEATKTPTVYLVSAKGVIMYRGAIDSKASAKAKGPPAQPWAAAAIDAYLAGRPIEKDTTIPEG